MPVCWTCNDRGSGNEVEPCPECGVAEAPSIPKPVFRPTLEEWKQMKRRILHLEGRLGGFFPAEPMMPDSAVEKEFQRTHKRHVEEI